MQHSVRSGLRAPHFHTWLVRLGAKAAMEKVHLTPGLTGKLGRSPRRQATTRQDLGGSSTGFEQTLASWSLGKCQSTCRAGGQTG